MSADLFSQPPDAAEQAQRADRPPLRPELPLAKRLNRNALTVAAVLMGITVVTALVMLRPSGDVPAGERAASELSSEPPVPSRPAFLDEPVRDTMLRSGVEAGSTPVPPPLNEPTVTDRGDGADIAPSHRASAWSASGAVDPYAGVADARNSYVPAPAAPAVSARVQAFQAALASPVLAGESGQRPAGSAADAAPSDDERLLSLGDSVLRAAMQATPAGPMVGGATSASQGAPSSPRAPPRAADPRRAFLEAAGDAGGATVAAQLEPAGSPHTLRPGTVIPAVLLTGINSELPGELVAQVSRNVYDSRTQRTLLVPKGAKLIGTYDNQVAAGQHRLLVAWTRLILPDGRSMRLPGLALKDSQGQTGAAGRVDNHTRRVFGNALLLSAIGAGLQLSQPRQGSILAAPSAGQVAAGAVGQELSQVALEILRRGMDVAPTITVPQGQPFTVFVNGDLVFDGPYVPAP
jgi:type IV secretion system protein VirB10